MSSYKIKPYTLKKAQQVGVEVKPSLNPKKKIDVYKDDRLITSIGDINYPDFPTYIETHGLPYAKERQRLYRLRHGEEGLRGSLASFLLW